MTLRDKIMDKYWLEYLEWTTKDMYWPEPRRFWGWFYAEIASKQHGKLEDYLK